VGKMAWCLCRLGSGRTRGTRGRTRGLSGSKHFGPKSETEMGACGCVRTALSVWIAPLGRVLCPCGYVRTAGGRLGRPAGDVLSTRVAPMGSDAGLYPKWMPSPTVCN
jgi:hypothetical protein